MRIEIFKDIPMIVLFKRNEHTTSSCDIDRCIGSIRFLFSFSQIILFRAWMFPPLVDFPSRESFFLPVSRIAKIGYNFY